MNDSKNAEEIFKECIDIQQKKFNAGVTEKFLQIKEELVKFYLKQEKYDVRFFQNFHKIKLFNIYVKQLILNKKRNLVS